MASTASTHNSYVFTWMDFLIQGLDGGEGRELCTWENLIPAFQKFTHVVEDSFPPKHGDHERPRNNQKQISQWKVDVSGQ